MKTLSVAADYTDNRNVSLSKILPRKIFWINQYLIRRKIQSAQYSHHYHTVDTPYHGACACSIRHTIKMLSIFSVKIRALFGNIFSELLRLRFRGRPTRIKKPVSL